MTDITKTLEGLLNRFDMEIQVFEQNGDTGSAFDWKRAKQEVQEWASDLTTEIADKKKELEQVSITRQVIGNEYQAVKSWGEALNYVLNLLGAKRKMLCKSLTGKYNPKDWECTICEKRNSCDNGTGAKTQ